MNSNNNTYKTNRDKDEEWVREDPKRNKESFKEKRKESQKNKSKTKWDDQ